MGSEDVSTENQVRRSGVMGTVPSGRVGPEYESNLTVTAMGRSGGRWSPS